MSQSLGLLLKAVHGGLELLADGEAQVALDAGPRREGGEKCTAIMAPPVVNPLGLVIHCVANGKNVRLNGGS